MALVKTKPTSPGRRSMVKVVNKDLHKGTPYAPLLEKQFQKSGRNNNGHITTRHKGGGHKHHYRVVDFKRNDKDGIPARVERLEYDPNRSANIALVVFADGERRYIIATKGMVAGQSLLNGSEAPIKAGNNLPIRNIPVGTTINNVEMQPGKGSQIARAAGGSAVLLAREGLYAQVRLRSVKRRIACTSPAGTMPRPERKGSNRSASSSTAARCRSTMRATGAKSCVRSPTMPAYDRTSSMNDAAPRSIASSKRASRVGASGEGTSGASRHSTTPASVRNGETA